MQGEEVKPKSAYMSTGKRTCVCSCGFVTCFCYHRDKPLGKQSSSFACTYLLHIHFPTLEPVLDNHNRTVQLNGKGLSLKENPKEWEFIAWCSRARESLVNIPRQPGPSLGSIGLVTVSLLNLPHGVATIKQSDPTCIALDSLEEG